MALCGVGVSLRCSPSLASVSPAASRLLRHHRPPGRAQLPSLLFHLAGTSQGRGAYVREASEMEGWKLSRIASANGLVTCENPSFGPFIETTNQRLHRRLTASIRS